MEIEVPPTIGDYEIGPMIGRGSFSVVHKCIMKGFNEPRCVKIVSKELINKDNLQEQFRREVHAIKSLKHPSIVRYINLFEDDNYFYLITELCPGQSLLQLLNSHGPLTPDLCRILLSQLLGVLSYLHSNGVFHRDIKPENIIVSSKYCIKLIDFGFCKFSPGTQLLKTFCGSLQYAAPECIMHQPYIGSKSDMWSIGIVMYTMACGQLPWTNSANINQIIKQIACASYQIPPHVDPLFADLISKLIVANPNERLSADECLIHPFMTPVSRTKLGIHNATSQSLGSSPVYQIPREVKPEYVWNPGIQIKSFSPKIRPLKRRRVSIVDCQTIRSRSITPSNTFCNE